MHNTAHFFKNRFKYSKRRFLQFGSACSILGLGLPVFAQTNNSSISQNPGLVLEQALKLRKEGRIIQALNLLENLVKTHPNFKAAQLLYADLLMLRNGLPVLEASAKINSMQELRNELNQRNKATNINIKNGLVPSNMLALAKITKDIIVVNTNLSRIYLLKNVEGDVSIAHEAYVSIGKNGFGKNIEGDSKTPLGVYFITRKIDQSQLKNSFYGMGALPINYPNPNDRRLGRTGSGIWFHGPPPSTFVRPPLSTNGCIVMADDDLRKIMLSVEPGHTPVLIDTDIKWVQADSILSRQQSTSSLAQAWWFEQLSNTPHIPNNMLFQKSPWFAARQHGGTAIRWQEGATPVVAVVYESRENHSKTVVDYWSKISNDWQII
jgi:L,D-peptidoglycan transpeptidase YkuD (ErfK/YbiS/YcfS/YnhG family)